METSTESPSATEKINFDLLAHMIVAMAIELEKIASPEVMERAKSEKKSVRRHLARKIANKFWIENNSDFKKLRIQFIEKNEAILAKQHLDYNPERTDVSIADVERWAFNDLVEYWATNSERAE